MEITLRVGSSEDFLKKFNPETQNDVARYKDRAYTSDKAPSLTDIKIAYGMPVFNSWLSIQLNSLNEYCGVKKKMSVEDMNSLADMIFIKYHYLKTSELLLFFFNFKMGEYGQLYGSVDPLKITTALSIFMKNRATDLTRIYNEEKRLKKEASLVDVIDEASYKELKDRAKTDIEAFKKLFGILPEEHEPEYYHEKWLESPDPVTNYLIDYNNYIKKQI